MAQATTPDSQFQEDPSLAGEDATQGKVSMFGKLKNKTRDKTSKLKTKLKHNSTRSGEEANAGADEDSSSSSEDEADAPVHNAVAGVTQPEYERQSEDEKLDSQAKESPTAPAENFPGNFAGIAAGESKEDDSGLSKDFQGLSTNDKDESTESQPEAEDSTPMTQKFQETKDQAKEKLTPSGGDSEQTYASPDKSPVAEQAQQTGDKATEVGKSWTQWAAEKVGYAKDTAAAKAPTTAEGKPIHEEAYGAVAGKAAASKDSLASKIPDRSSIPSDPAQQSYAQKATGGIYGAKDKLYTSTQPGEHDKALSQQVTEAVGNLPATLKSSFGFGGKTGVASSPSTTSAHSDVPLSPSEETSGAPPQSPGIVSRITGLFSSKKPATDNSTPSEPTISETGAETKTNVSEEANLS